MRFPVHASYTVAWFKLADFVARGEKERALHVHKLLMHSVGDEAVSFQLEGDILLAFDDDGAIDCYHIAANLYKKAGKMQQAVSVYEHLSSFKDDDKVLEALLDIYCLLKHEDSMLNTFSRLARVCLENDNFTTISHLFYKYLFNSPTSLQGFFCIRFVTALILYDEKNLQINSYVQQTIDVLEEHNSEEDLLQFLSYLEGLDKQMYHNAIEYLDHNF